MKFLLFLFLSSFSAFAQLARPVLTGECKGNDGHIVLSLQEGSHSLVLQKNGKALKSCAIDLTNSTHFQRGFERVNFYYRLSACDKRLLGEQGFSGGPLAREGLLVVELHPPKINGLANALTDQKSDLVCEFKAKSWSKIVELGKKSQRKSGPGRP